ncbi:MAG TPA: hypothetical protein VEC12_05620 [Bacteroidia bacterium]|nr:hypothetical protein [Bacteroidia bacterium]
MNLLRLAFTRFENSTLLMLLGASILLIIPAAFVDIGYAYLTVMSAAFNYAGISLLIKNGSFIRSNFMRYLSISISLLLIAILFKIVHLRGADILFIVAFTAVFTIYFVWFIKKHKKQLTDIIKAAWLLFFLSGALFKLMHWPYADILVAIDLILFIFLLASLIIPNFKKFINS